MFGFFKSDEEKYFKSCLGALEATPVIVARNSRDGAAQVIAVARREIERGKQRLREGSDLSSVIHSLERKSTGPATAETVGQLIAQNYFVMASFAGTPRFGRKARMACHTFETYLGLDGSQSSHEQAETTGEAANRIFSGLARTLTTPLSIRLLAGDALMVASAYSQISEQASARFQADTGNAMNAFMSGVLEKTANISDPTARIDVTLTGGEWTSIYVWLGKLPSYLADFDGRDTITNAAARIHDLIGATVRGAQATR